MGTFVRFWNPILEVDFFLGAGEYKMTKPDQSLNIANNVRLTPNTAVSMLYNRMGFDDVCLSF